MSESSSGFKIVHQNKKAWHDYHILENMEVGIVLTGSEIKSIRAGAIQLKDSYVSIESNELFLNKAHISEYKESSYNNHKPERKRKLLAHKEEIKKLDKKINEKGFTLIPLKVYLKNGLCKLEIAIAKGKNKGDKRDSMKSKDAKREMDRSLKHNKY